MHKSIKCVAPLFSSRNSNLHGTTSSLILSCGTQATQAIITSPFNPQNLGTPLFIFFQNKQQIHERIKAKTTVHSTITKRKKITFINQMEWTPRNRRVAQNKSKNDKKYYAKGRTPPWSSIVAPTLTPRQPLRHVLGNIVSLSSEPLNVLQKMAYAFPSSNN